MRGILFSWGGDPSLSLVSATTQAPWLVYTILPSPSIPRLQLPSTYTRAEAGVDDLTAGTRGQPKDNGSIRRLLSAYAAPSMHRGCLA